MKINVFIFFFLSFPIWAFAQDLDPSVLASEGGIDSNDDISLEWTLGEIAVATLYTNSTMITEGFHQPSLTVSDYYETTNIELSHQSTAKIKVVPNPVRSIVNIQMEFSEESALNISLFDLAGIQLLEKLNQSPTDSFELNLSGFPAGIYLLRFSNQQGRVIRTFKLSKITY
jgi:hypothetical protein